MVDDKAPWLDENVDQERKCNRSFDIFIFEDQNQDFLNIRLETSDQKKEAEPTPKRLECKAIPVTSREGP
jgi:hypothetical protein